MRINVAMVARSRQLELNEGIPSLSGVRGDGTSAKLSPLAEYDTVCVVGQLVSHGMMTVRAWTAPYFFNSQNQRESLESIQ